MAAPSVETSRALAQSAADFAAADADLRSVRPGHKDGVQDALWQARAAAYVHARRIHAETIDKAELELRESAIESGEVSAGG